MWRIEALIAAGRPADANRAAHEDGFADAAAWQLVRASFEARWSGEGLNTRTAYIHRSILRDVFADQPAALEFGDEARTAALIDEALARLGGNRSTHLTFIEGGRLVRAKRVISPRNRVELIQERLLNQPARQVRDALADYARRYPDVPFGWTYASEIDLWRGDYELALASFEELWQQTKTRWAYVGSAACAYLLGREDQALARWAEGLEVYGEYLTGEATHTYLGELWRKRGELDRARKMFEHTLVATSRLGAWINLALVGLALDDAALLDRALEPVHAQAPMLLWEASQAVGAPASTRIDPGRDSAASVLEQALVMMRGNRSSRLLTFVDRQGRFRVLAQEHARRWIDLARTSSELALAQLAFAPRGPL